MISEALSDSFATPVTITSKGYGDDSYKMMLLVANRSTTVSRAKTHVPSSDIIYQRGLSINYDEEDMELRELSLRFKDTHVMYAG